MLIICASVAGLEPWQNPHVVAEGTEPAHALLPPFASEDAALAHARGMAADNSSMRSVSLDGTWRFHLHGGLPGRPSVQTPPFFSPLFDERGWFDLPVPSSWEMYGHSHAIYANVEYPFLEQVTSAGRYPSYSQAIESVEVPQEENPVGSFRRTFVLPQAWLQRLGEDGSCEESGVCWDVLLHFEAAGSSAMTVWLNGVRLGYAEDSKAAVEWRVPRSALRPGGRQLLAVEVLRWSDASYMESQDMWRLSGLSRSVHIHARPRSSIRDFFVSASPLCPQRDKPYPPACPAELEVRVAVHNGGGIATPPHTLVARVQLFDGSTPQLRLQHRVPSVEPGAEFEVRLRSKLDRVRLWSDEAPHLYYLVIALLHGTHVLEATSAQVGFRDVEVVGGQLKLNGAPLLVKGVNRHEFDAVDGRAVSRRAMTRDVRLMKRLHLNALRMAHYPNDAFMYRLANEHGLLVVDEANIESHGAGYGHASLADKSAWLSSHLQRTRNMVERDKNHPCVVIWSLGNEAGNGANFHATYKWLKARDPSRPVQYAHALLFPTTFDPLRRQRLDSNTDLFVPMYPSWDEVDGYGAGAPWAVKVQPKAASNPRETERDLLPMITCEYAHVM